MSEVANIKWNGPGSRLVTLVLGGMNRFKDAWLARNGRGKVRHMVLVESLELGNRRQLFLIACDEHRFLVGAGSDRVGTLVAMPEPTSDSAQGGSPTLASAPRATGTPPSVRNFKPEWMQRQALEQGGMRGLQLVRPLSETSCGAVTCEGVEAGRLQ